jgi:hypothetical protein
VQVVTLAEKSGAGCALAVWRDQLHVAWTGRDYRLNLGASADGRTLAHRRRLDDKAYRQTRDSSDSLRTVPLAPALAAVGDRLTVALCGHRGEVVVAWAGSDRVVNLVRLTGSGPTAPVRLPEAKTVVRPELVVFRDELVLGWTGSDDRLNLAHPLA